MPRQPGRSTEYSTTGPTHHSEPRPTTVSPDPLGRLTEDDIDRMLGVRRWSRRRALLIDLVLAAGAWVVVLAVVAALAYCWKPAHDGAAPHPGQKCGAAPSFTVKHR